MEKTRADCHILVIDDDEAIRDSVTYALELEGYTVHRAVNGQNGLEMIKNMSIEDKKPDLIFLDLMMPKMNGWEFVEALQTDENLKNLKIIIITAAGNVSPPAQVTDVLKKPFELDTLINIARKYTVSK